MNKLTEWLVKPFIEEEFGAPAGMLPSPSQKKIKKAKKRLDMYGDRSVYSVSEIEEDLPKIKKVVGIYGGRFQPFGPHHLKTYQWLAKQVDEAYIVTSNIKKPPRHPMNFNEKVRHMVKMGVPKNRIIEERTPYKAINTLKKFDEDTTAVIYIFGAKDVGRLKGGKYFDDYKKNKNKMVGFRERGYILTAPHQSIRVGSQEVSGTVMRDLLGSPEYKKNRKKLFKQAFGYFDQGIFNMMHNKFKKLYEFIDNNLDKIQKLIREGSMMVGSPVDDGPPIFYMSFNDYKRNSKAWLEKSFEGVGWQVIKYMISKNAKDPLTDFTIRYNVVPAVSYGNLYTTNASAVAKYKKNIENRVLNNVGFKIIKWFGLKDDFSGTTGVDIAQPVLPGTHNAEKNTELSGDLKEDINLNEEVKFLLEVDGMLLEEGVKFNNFLKDWSKKAKQPFSKIRKTMMNKNTFSIAKLNDFSVDKVLGNAKKGFKAYQKILNYVPDKIANKLAKTKFGQKKEKALVKLDNYLKNHPKLKRVMGIGAAAAVTYAWTKMTFIGDPEYDLDLSAAASAAALGEVSFADLFSGQMGTKFLILTAIGATTGLTAPYTKILGSVGTMAAGVSFGAYRAYKAHKQKKADTEKKAKTSAPDTVKNPNPRGRKKTINRQSAIRWVAKNKGTKAAQKYVKSISEIRTFSPEWWSEELTLEDEPLYWKHRSLSNQKKYIGTHDTPKKIDLVNPSGKKERNPSAWMKGKDGWEILDSKKAKVAKTKEYSDEQAMEETGEYFNNKDTKKAAPGLARNRKQLVQKIKNAPEVVLNSTQLQNLDNSDAGNILDASEEGGVDGMMKKGKELAKKYKKGWKYITKNIQSGVSQEAPIALRDKKGELRLMAGNTRLMANTAHGRNIPVKIIDYDGKFQYKKKEIKEQIDITDETKELLLMGGAAGHMSHPFDDNHLTFGDFKNIIDMSLEGKLSREDNVTEKLDGQNLMVSYVDGELRGARNKGHLKLFGKTSLNINGMKSMFSGRGDIEKAFVGSMKDLEKAIGALSDKQKEKVFGNGSKWMNLEIMYPATANVIDYDVSELFFHGSVEINESGQIISQVTDSARMLEGMIRQANAGIQKRFKISKPIVLNLPKVQDFSKKKKYFLSKLRKLQTIYRLKDNDTLGMHNEMYWREYIFNGAKQHKYKISRIVLESLVKRWAYLDKSFRLDKKNIKHAKFLSWTKGVDKFDHKKLAYDNIKPLELLFLELGAEILKNLEGFLAVNPKKAVQKIKKELKTAILGLRTSKDIKKIDLLKKNLQKINSIGGIDAVVPSEGLVFKYKGKMYKFTGAFAPINQIIGALKF